MMIGRATLKGRVTVLAGLAVAVAAGAAAARTDLLLNRGFGNALETERPGLSFQATVAKPPAQAPAGDEGYWLTRAEVESPSPFAKALAVGDRISIAGQDGRQRQLEVIDLKAIGGNPGRTGRTPGQPHLMLVTCRVSGETSERAEAPVRFIIEAEASAEPAAPAPAKAL